MVDYLGGFPAEFRKRAFELKDDGQLIPRLQAQYSLGHQVTNNGALYEFTMGLKRQFLKSSSPISKIRFSDKLNTLHRTLGLHTYVSRVQGAKLKAKHEIRVCSVFKTLPMEFLRMVVVHELAHVRHKAHDKAFYRLCEHMEPDYMRYETDLRLWLFAHADV